MVISDLNIFVFRVRETTKALLATFENTEKFWGNENSSVQG